MSSDRSESSLGSPEDRTMPKRVFISHASADDAIVRGLQQALDLQGRAVWIDSRELRGGDQLWPGIQAAIEQASAFIVLISPDGLQSKWIGQPFRERADRVEQGLIDWGRAIYHAALPGEHTDNVLLGLDDLLDLLDRLEAAGDPAATIGLATSLHTLLQNLGRPRLLQRIGRVRDAAAAALGGEWGHAAFQAKRTRIEQLESAGRLREAFDGAETLLGRARSAGVGAYEGADYDLAVACFLFGRIPEEAGGAGQALAPLDEARERFEAIARERSNRAAERMASACLTERGDCLVDLGRLDEAARAYEESIRRDEKRGAERDVAVGKDQLGTVRLQQGRHQGALDVDARERFERLGEPGSVAGSWHQTGMACRAAGRADEAEAVYRQSLAIKVRLGDLAGQATTLGQLGLLYDEVLDRPEEAVAF